MFHRYHTLLHKRQSELLLRELPTAPTAETIDLSSNDYLCLRKDERVINAGCEAAHRYGAGTCGSRLLSGNNDLFEQLEQQIAKDLLCEDAIIFSSGFQLNSTVIPTLFENWTVLSDKLNHASIYHGLLNNPHINFIRYKHRDMDDLRLLIKQIRHNQTNSKQTHIAIITETLFGMEGRATDLIALRELCRQYDIFLFLDDSHAIGLYGPYGFGMSSTLALSDIPHAIMGTFSKALGGAGGFLACNAVIKKYLLQKCPGFIYSTAPSPFTIGSALAAWRLVPEMHDERSRIFLNAQRVAPLLESCGENPDTSLHIHTLSCADNHDLMHKRHIFEQSKISLAAVRQPTAPTPRLRIAINANTTHAHIELFRDVLHSLYCR